MRPRVTAHAAAVRTLTLFNEKADQFLASQFFGQTEGGGAMVEFSRESGWDAIHVGPDEESTRAAVLTLRLFVQNNSGISLQNLAALYNSLPVSAGAKRSFNARRSHLTALLELESPLAISDERLLSYWDILSIFLYGEYAHVNERFRQTYDDLRTTPFFPLFQSCFVRVLEAFARCLSSVRETNRGAIEELTASDAA